MGIAMLTHGMGTIPVLPCIGHGMWIYSYERTPATSTILHLSQQPGLREKATGLQLDANSIPFLRKRKMGADDEEVLKASAQWPGGT